VKARNLTRKVMPGPLPSDDASPIDDVVRRAQAGDVVAFEALYLTHAPAIYALCRRMAGDEREARDFAQDAFVRAWERLTTFRGQSAFATWLHRLAVNTVLEHVRSARREDGRFNDEDVDLLSRTDGAFDARADARMDLEAALARLPRGARVAFVLHDIEGYSHDEVAALTGTAPGTARAQAWRARNALLNLLDR
jgi:RNA polymerase sigma-70 factor (ECF subfamily)